MSSFVHYDSHLHLMPHQADTWAEALVANMQANNVRAGAISGVGLRDPDSDRDVQRIAATCPGRLLPMLSHIDLNQSAELDRALAELETGRWAGVGELFLDASLTLGNLGDNPPAGTPDYPLPADGPGNAVLGGLIRHCTDHDMPILIHCEVAAVLEDLLGRYPESTVLWAHCDYRTPLADVKRIFETYPWLRVDFGPMIRCGYWDTEHGISDWLNTDRDFWLAICGHYFDRMVLGTDAIREKYADPDRYRHIYESYADFFGRLPAEKAEALTGGNFKRLFRTYLSAHPEFTT